MWKRLVSIALGSVVMAASALGSDRPSIDDVAWIAGSWVMDEDGTRMEERWMDPVGGAMVGLSRTTRGDRMTGFEYLRIVADDEGVGYVAQPEGRPPTRFALVSWEEGEAVFENREHDFPQVIRYVKKAGGGLSAVIEGPDAEGAWSRVEMSFRDASAPQFLKGSKADSALPFSEAVRVGNLLFLSGKIGRKPGTMEVVPGGIQAETRQALDNIEAVLERHGSSMDRVVKCTVMIDDISQWAAMNEVYVTYFPHEKPARSAFGADGLALGAALEIECIAVVD